jgi:hypothetical protein
MSHTINVSDLPHGNYVLKIHVEAELYTSTKPIPSNELIHKYACYQDIESDNPLFIVNFPKNAMMHMDIPVEYLIVSNEENITYHVKIDIDGSERTTLELVTNKI